MDTKDLNARILKSLSIEGIVVDVFENPDRDDTDPDHRLLVDIRVLDDEGFFVRKNDTEHREVVTREQHRRVLEKQSEEARRLLQQEGMLG